MTVLVVEDDPEMRALLRDVLEREGYRVIDREDGKGLATLVECERFDVVVLDKEMPGPSGLDLLTFLRHRLPAVPVVVITAFGGAAVAEEAARRGAFSYIEKPFRVSAIVDAVAGATRFTVGVKPGA